MQNSVQFRLSIITCSFKDLENLRRTADSVLAQTEPVEWLIIDGDSGADHREFFGSLSSDRHLIKWISEKDLGIYDGMNKGFELSSGEIVLFLNSGDLLIDKFTVNRVLETEISSAWHWAVALAVRVDSNHNPRAVWEYLNPDIGGLALGTRTFCHQAVFYKRHFLSSIMPYDINNLASDHLINIRAFRRSTPEMLPFVSTLFLDGGISSKRPFSASMKDLRRIRIEENLLLGNNKLIDLILSNLIVLMVQLGSITWKTMRVVSRKFIQKEKRKTF